MKASELRIGNFINDFGDGVGQVTSIHSYDGEDDVQTTANSLALPISNYSPIPLTEDWLVKFGFEKYHKAATTGNEYYRMSVVDYLTEPGRLEIWTGHPFVFCIGDDKGCFSNSIEHVHQLQNLYYALTGEELTRKE